MGKLIKLPVKQDIEGIDLPISKSIANRQLLMLALEEKKLPNLDPNWPEDVKVMHQALGERGLEKNLKLSGSALRFLLAYFSIKEGIHVLVGEKRLMERPINELAMALGELGAEISFIKQEGKLPIEIKGKPLEGGQVSINVSQSSQYLTALLLIAPYLSKGLSINYKTEISSVSYVQLNIGIMKKAGVSVHSMRNSFSVEPGRYCNVNWEPEADWSSASFIYLAFLLSNIESLIIKNIENNSLQGDQSILGIFEEFGVQSTFEGDHLKLGKKSKVLEKHEFDLNASPDLIMPIAVALAVQSSKEAVIKGIQTLKHKESDRVQALISELKKMGSILVEKNNELIIKPSTQLPKALTFEAHNDHRIIMSLAPLAFLIPEVGISGGETVNKSFPHFWLQLAKMGLVLNAD